MSKPANGWMTWGACLMLMLPVTGCATAISKPAICNGSAKARDAHAEALLQDGGDRSVVTGAELLALLDAGCAD